MYGWFVPQKRKSRGLKIPFKTKLKDMKNTIEYKGIEFKVEYDYQPEEAQVNYYADGSGYPGCAEQVELYEISHKGVSFLEFLDSEIEDIELEITNQLHRIN